MSGREWWNRSRCRCRIVDWARISSVRIGVGIAAAERRGRHLAQLELVRLGLELLAHIHRLLVEFGEHIYGVEQRFGALFAGRGGRCRRFRQYIDRVLISLICGGVVVVVRSGRICISSSSVDIAI